jgi:hypothetical protein
MDSEQHWLPLSLSVVVVVVVVFILDIMDLYMAGTYLICGAINDVYNCSIFIWIFRSMKFVCHPPPGVQICPRMWGTFLVWQGPI